ncbi:MAG: filamentous hemagglutinin N-terminal domain-containing protein, partial [Selenomonadaceae bacterium]|nr:filamentous hemagglutinin N-terminal domain-containing protein [Selenomonadaceae bacterium]
MLRKIRKKQYKALCKLLLGGVAFLSSMFINQNTLKALPVEPSTQHREHIDSITSNAGVMNIKGTGNAFINWRDFSVGKGEIVNFSGMNNMLNYVSFKNPSLIYGQINADAIKNFYIINPSGILFGPDSKVVTKNFYVSTRSLSDSDINTYLNSGSVPSFGMIDTSLINNGGLKSSDIMGTYDVADGDVMFLGQVQANSLKVEGNTIQIRNTKNITDANGNILTGDKVTFYSNNPVEVGYKVTTSDASSFELKNPFSFDLDDVEDMDVFINALAEHYNIYLYKDSDGELINFAYDDKYNNNVDVSKANYEALVNLYYFYQTQIRSATDDNDKIIVAMAMDEAIKEKLGESDPTKKLALAIYFNGVVEGMQYTDTVTTLDWTDTNSNSTYSSAYSALSKNYNDIYGSSDNSKYKYFIADAIGDKNMPDSANYLGWTAQKFNGDTQTINDYRLVENVTDLQNINFSKWTAEDQLSPTEGKIHGNYMLDSDINASSISSFKPLGYSMDFRDYFAKSELVNFNGLNFTISGLKTNNTLSDHVGLFSVFSGTVKNLRLKNFTVGTANSENAGALIGMIGYLGGTVDDYAGWVNKADPLNTSIKNVSLLGDTNSIKGNYAGGLVGSIGYGSTIDQDTQVVPFYSDKDGKDYYFELPKNIAEQLNGWYELDGSEYYRDNDYGLYAVPGFPTVNFENVENFGKITSSYSGGGILGYKRHGNVFFTNVTNKGSIISGSIAGGIIGLSESSGDDNYPNLNDEEKSLSFDRVSNSGVINAEGYAGGIAGKIGDDYSSEYLVSIKQSWNEGNVTSSGEYAGGIFAYVYCPSILKEDQLFNSANIKGHGKVGGLLGYLYGSRYWDDSILTNSYNTGTVTGYGKKSGYVGGIIGYLNYGILSNVYNLGTVNQGRYVGGLIGYSESSFDKVTNSYNLGEIKTGTYLGGIAGYVSNENASFENVYNANGQTDLKLFGGGDTPEQDNVKNTGDNPDVSEIYSKWNIDKDGTNSEALWRVYTNPDNPNDTTRQPLLSAFLQNATIQRYNELSTAGSVDPANLVTVESLNMHSLHDSSGEILDIRYNNTGKSSMYAKSGKNYFYTVNPSFVEFDILNPEGNTEFKVDDTNYFSKALIKSSQFGYNFKFTNNKNDWTASTGTDADLNAEITSAKNSPADNTIYLKMGVNNIPDEPDPKPIEEFTETEENGEDIYYTITINVSNGTYSSTAWPPYSFDTKDSSDSSKPGYTTNNLDDADISDFKITGEIIKTDDEQKTFVVIGYDKYYSVGNGGLKDNGDGTYSVKLKVGDHTYYNFIINPGNITTQGDNDPEVINETIWMDIFVNDGDYQNGTFTSNGYYFKVMSSDQSGIDGANLIAGLLGGDSTNLSDDYDYIINMLSGGILKVVDRDNEHDTTTLEFDSNKVTVNDIIDNPDGTTTYKIVKNDDSSNKEYKIDRDGMTFTYVENGIAYKIAVNPGIITADLNSTTKSATIKLVNGKVTSNGFNLENADTTDYTITGEGADDITTLLSGVLEVVKNEDGTGTTLKFNDGVTVTETTKNADDTTTYNVTKDGTGYEFIKNTDGTYTYVNGSTTYNVEVVPGTLTYEVKINVGDMTKTDNVVTSGGGYTVTNDNKVTNTNGVISELLNGKLEVVETLDGLNTTLAAKDSGALTNDGNGNYTYKDTNDKIYKFTKSGNVYTYEDETSGVKYEVTVEQGDLQKIYNINIEVSDGVFYINEDGNGTLSLELVNGYEITKNADGSQFTENFNVKYNDPIDITQITGPCQTTVSITNKETNENYKTGDVSATNGVYNSIAKNENGVYTISATKENTKYNINIKPGLVVSDTRVPVTISVKDGKIVDGIFEDGGYSVTNTDIETLLKNKLEVVNVEGKTTVRFKEEVANKITENADGSKTYKDGTNSYTFTPNVDGSYTYKITNPNGEMIEYKVSVEAGEITKENNAEVILKVNDGTKKDGEFSGNGYTVSNEVIGKLLEGNLEVVETADNKTTVTVKSKDNLSNKDGKISYIATDGKTYHFTKIG